jgi:hypothetical protein
MLVPMGKRFQTAYEHLRYPLAFSIFSGLVDMLARLVWVVFSGSPRVITLTLNVEYPPICSRAPGLSPLNTV